MRIAWILPIYKGSFICYERLPETSSDSNLGQELFPRESI